jgi:3-deoxy-manno-octulosonate cytidylyltransferase (CMP-KDO synthetase)
LADDDLIINLQGDQPLIDPCSIEKLVQLFVDAPGEFEMATLAFQLNDPVDQNDPMQVKMVFDQAFFALYFSRAKIPFNRDAEDESPIYKHLGIYGYTRRFVREFGRLPVSRLENVEKLEQLRALENGYRIKIAVVDANPPEVDMPEDIAKCEAFLAKQS